MWRLIHDFLKWAPGALFGASLAAAAIWDGAKQWIGGQVAMGWTQIGDPWVGIIVLFSVIAYIAAVVWTGKKATQDFEAVEEWSVSIDLGHMASSHENRKRSRYIRDMCRFVNHSHAQARVIDITISIPYIDKRKQPVLLSATRRLPIEDTRIGPIVPARYDPFLSFPIRIEANGLVEGRIEFAIPQEGVDSDDLNLLGARATIVESRSHQTRTVAEGEVYDALKRKGYRGSLGAPHPVWGPRLRMDARLRAE